MTDNGVALVFNLGSQPGNHFAILCQRCAARQAEDQPQTERFLQCRDSAAHGGVITAHLSRRCRQ
ncbi:hypothetical protein D3C76_1558270 [compost metagenome]